LAAVLDPGDVLVLLDHNPLLRRATTALANAFGDGKLVPLSVGKRFSF
jgi:hypothetical protein